MISQISTQIVFNASRIGTVMNDDKLIINPVERLFLWRNALGNKINARVDMENELKKVNWGNATYLASANRWIDSSTTRNIVLQTTIVSSKQQQMERNNDT
jgi:hypothetical protein